MSTISLREMLDGPDAFYNQKDYLKTTRAELSQEEALPPSYTWNTKERVPRSVSLLFSALFFPLGLFKLLHVITAKIAILPASSPWLLGLPKNHFPFRRANIDLHDEWKYKRITLEVSRCQVDVLIIGKASTLGNGRWLPVSNANAEFYEDKPYKQDFKQILTQLNGNAIVFNYPGVVASKGLPK